MDGATDVLNEFLRLARKLAPEEMRELAETMKQRAVELVAAADDKEAESDGRDG